MIRTGTGATRTLFLLNRTPFFCRHASDDLNIEKLEKDSGLDVDVLDEAARRREEQIELSRNKSRLRSQHRNVVNGQNPYSEPQLWIHGTVKYLRRTYGKYGSASGVNPAICWPTKKELNNAREYERVANPFTIPEMIAAEKVKQREKEESIRARQEEIVKRMEKLDIWKQELFDRIAKKEQEAKIAKQRKERMIEEVRRHFGYTVDPRDERFKEMLEKKEKEQKKAMKEERKKLKEAKMLEKLLKKDSENKKSSTTENVQETADINSKSESGDEKKDGK